MSGVSLPGGAGPDAGIISSGGDISGELGATLGAAFDSVMDTPSEPAADPAAEPVAEPTAEPASEPVAAAEPEEVADPAAEPATGAAPVAGEAPQYQMTPDGKAYMVPKSDFQNIQSVQKYHTAVSQLFPTQQDAHNSYLQASDHRAMSNDWASGSDQGVEAVLNYWAGADHQAGSPAQQAFQRSFMKMADKLPSMIQKSNPQAYEAMVSGMVSKAVEMAYEKAAQTGTPEDLQRAQELDWGATGQYKTELPKVDPVLKEKQAFEKRQQEFNQQRDSMLNSQLESYNKSQIEGAKFSELNGLIDQQLAKVKDRYSDIAYGDLKNGIQQEIINAMAGNTTPNFPQGIPGQREWYAEHKQAFNQLINDFKTSWNPTAPGKGLEARAQAFRQDYINRANRFLPSIAAPRIATATRTPGSARAGQPAKAAKAATPAPAAQPQRDPNKRLTGDEWQAELNNAMRV